MNEVRIAHSKLAEIAKLTVPPVRYETVEKLGFATPVNQSRAEYRDPQFGTRCLPKNFLGSNFFSCVATGLGSEGRILPHGATHRPIDGSRTQVDEFADAARGRCRRNIACRCTGILHSTG
ncbi:hypothetical protein HMP06_3518 [Sphingomonas sp. HMP6]|nr:hypothetical protein HMP06_3518 [Sphingomonas sp. HMP6]